MIQADISDCGYSNCERPTSEAAVPNSKYHYMYDRLSGICQAVGTIMSISTIHGHCRLSASTIHCTAGLLNHEYSHQTVVDVVTCSSVLPEQHSNRPIIYSFVSWLLPRSIAAWFTVASMSSQYIEDLQRRWVPG